MKPQLCFFSINFCIYTCISHSAVINVPNMDIKTGIILLSLGYLCYCMKSDPEPVSELDLNKFTGCFYTVSIQLYVYVYTYV